MSGGGGEQDDVGKQLTPADGALYWKWLAFCFSGIMFSFILYGLFMEYATSGGRKLHEFSLIFVTSTLYTTTAYVGKTLRGEKPSTVPTYKLFFVAMLSMGSTFFSVRSLRYVIFPVQVLAKSCKPIPVMIMGAFLGKHYPLKKYLNVVAIVIGIALYMLGGDAVKADADSGKGGVTMAIGCVMLALSLSFDGATGAYEDKIMQKDHVGPFELMFNIQLGKAILAFLSLVILDEVGYFFVMVRETGPVLLALGLTGAMGQVFIFVTIARFGALTCSLIGLGRKIVTLIVSIIVYQHPVDTQQGLGLSMAIGAMVYNFADKGAKRKKPVVDARDVETAEGVELAGLLDAKGSSEEVDELGGLEEEKAEAPEVRSGS
mmetsp:Transcript_22281/g.68777  ORF Transcript_22281/g.68777 Transcript_22281/m.68777 type:complete len:375 (-) Transcript_22281:24-1148(-)